MSEGKTLDEWIAYYDKKTPEPFERDERYSLVYFPDIGFCEYGITSDMVVINQLAGDGRFWKRAAEVVARLLHYNHLGTWTIRKNIPAYIRLFNYRIDNVEKLSDGRKRFFCTEKSTGKKGIISPAFTYKSGAEAYFVTWEI